MNLIKDHRLRKSYFLIWLYLATADKLVAQNKIVYEPFSVTVGAGIAIQQSGSMGGVFMINPGYMIKSKFKPGLQFEAVGDNIKSLNSYILTFDYYFINKSEIRFFGGGGYGFYNSNFFTQPAEPPEVLQAQWTTGTMGGMIRMGFEWYHINLGIAYNFAPTMYVSNGQLGYPTTTNTYKNGFFGLTLSVIICRQKKREKKRP
jgi:hypothetical protein